jgi:hypothetical protein
MTAIVRINSIIAIRMKVGISGTAGGSLVCDSLGEGLIIWNGDRVGCRMFVGSGDEFGDPVCVGGGICVRDVGSGVSVGVKLGVTVEVGVGDDIGCRD